jgi:hypothetical protein
MFVDMTVMDVMQMTVVEIVGVSLMAYRHVPAAGLVHMIVLGMY